MRKLIIAASLAASLAVPALAQDLETYTEDDVTNAAATIEAAAISDTLYQHFWCGTTFLIINQVMTNQGRTEDAASAMSFADVLMGKAATEAVATGIPEADFNALGSAFRVVAISQTGPDAEADYALDDCVAAAQAP